MKRRVIGFVHRIAARAARARAPPIPIKLFGAATGARRAGTAHDVASRASASLREAAPREPPASAMPPSRRPVPSGAAPGERRPTRAADAIAAAGAAGRPIFWARSEPDPSPIRARSEPDPSPIRARSGHDPGAPRPSILIQACAARIAKAGDDRDPFFPSTKAVAYRYLARIGALQASRAGPRGH
ncbi:hypothetical protein AQ860_21510 [Burkholderia pseudomallei]|nr:hypothetical protein AQ760_14265 [Burkholderia pseudomallei]OMZ25949.1 hypothetical protein AQ859_25185 [Burkholderia pseudomallei]OMZ30913.1 hypothetical protein AQ860_21510 [Burkholderia pseudomallei]ONC60888.1 hypothetical protein AQ919_04460 [Burkholderia pseudomallei]